MYRKLKGYARHDVVNHSAEEYARHNPDGTVSHVNSAEFKEGKKRKISLSLSRLSDVGH